MDAGRLVRITGGFRLPVFRRSRLARACPSVPDHVSLWDSLLKFRREFDQYVNLRPVRLMPNVVSPLRTSQQRLITKENWRS